MRSSQEAMSHLEVVGGGRVEWLQHLVIRDRVAALGRSPEPLETSLPGVLAVGDVRQGSVKRFASAVGEGSVAVQVIHRLLAARHDAETLVREP